MQVEFLQWFQTVYFNNDVIVGNLPTGAGKSICLKTIANWISANKLGKCSILVSTKMLQDQLANDFTDTPLLKGIANYTCYEQNASCKLKKRYFGKLCQGCAFTTSVEACKNSDIAIFNLHIHNAIKIKKPILLIDEAHNCADFAQSLHEINLWQPEVEYPDGLDEYVLIYNYSTALEYYTALKIYIKESGYRDKFVIGSIDLIYKAIRGNWAYPVLIGGKEIIQSLSDVEPDEKGVKDLLKIEFNLEYETEE
jgi:hypothetical protein